MKNIFVALIVLTGYFSFSQVNKTEQEYSTCKYLEEPN